MNGNPLKKMVRFIVRYIWIICPILIVLELFSTLFSATTLLRQTSQSILQAQAGEISGRVDGVLRLLNGFANDKVIGDTSLPIFDRAVMLAPYQESYGLYMLAVLDQDFNVSSSDETEPSDPPFNLAGRDYLQRMKSTGQYQVTDMIIAGADNVTKNYTIAVPLIEDGDVKGGLFGSIYFDDIEDMLSRDKQGTFYLLGREQTVMAGGLPQEFGFHVSEVYEGCYLLGTSIEEVSAHLQDGNTGSFWVNGHLGPAFIVYSPVAYTDWTLIYEARFDMVIPLVLPLLIVKILCYILICFLISHFGCRYLKYHLSDVSHLLDRVTSMRRELFRTEQSGFDSLLELTEQGLTDQLTGLATRGVLLQCFNQITAQEYANGILCFLDLDDLKKLNDEFGHDAGDAALIHFSKTLKSYEKEYAGIASRYGGDEFLLVLPNISRDKARSVISDLCKSLSYTLEYGKQRIPIHGSIGAAFYPLSGRSLEELVSKADLALYTAKSKGKNQYFIFESE